ncbi:MAG: hypothetical protein LBQ06_00785 [Frankiaceae bacterium]|nr:hypothetical protein [Frankiaceae bacterium]
MTALLPEDLLVTRALVALDGRLPAGFPHMRLLVVGGYALQVQGIRTDPGEATDVDYIGRPLPGDVREMVNEIGLQYGLGPGWLNNDVLLSGATDIDGIELATGPLRFHALDAPRLKHFLIEVADPQSLLRMKLVAVDTQLASFLDSGNTADFTRGKDFADLRRICEHEGLPAASLVRLVDEMSADGYLLEPAATLSAALQALAGRSDLDILANLKKSSM